MKKLIILIGKPGAGKGTLISNFLPEHGDYEVLSPGNMFRAECAKRSRLGKKIAKSMESGELLPDDIVNEVVFKAISESDKNVILDGYPRTLTQAEAMLKNRFIPDKIVEVFVEDEEVKRRVEKRVICKKCQRSFNLDFMKPKKEGICDECGGKLEFRADDKPEVVEKRLLDYHQKTAPVIKFFAESSIEVEEFDGTSFDYEKFNRLIVS